MGKLEGNANTPEDIKLVEESLKSTRALMQTLLQTMKTSRLYEARHPMFSKYLDRLQKDFDHYFDEFDVFVLQVQEHRLLYRGNLVYESQDVKESLAFLFFKDGIREIQFFKGLEFKEVVGFLNIMSRADSINRSEDDLVTLFWEKDFTHIVIATVDEFLEEGIGLVPATLEDLNQGMEYKRDEEGEVDEKAQAEKEKEEAGPAAEGLKKVLNLSPDQTLAQACHLTPDEMEEIKRKVQREQESEYLYLLAENLIEILLHLGEDMDAYENMITYFERAIGSFLEQDRVERAVVIMKNLNDAMESIALKDKQIFAIRRIMESASGPRPIELLGKIIKQDGKEDSELILQYFQLVTKQAVDPLCRLLSDSDSTKWKKVICSRLAELCQRDVQPLSKFLSDPNPTMVCHILYVLGEIGHASTVKYLRNLVVHGDPKVREETLQTLILFGDKGKDLILKFLDDPSAVIRGKASLSLARVAKKDAVKPLLAVILSEGFYQRDFNEKASFFRALGETGSKEPIPILEKIAKKKKWFKRSKWDEMRICAANTLRFLAADEEKAPSHRKEHLKRTDPTFH